MKRSILVTNLCVIFLLFSSVFVQVENSVGAEGPTTTGTDNSTSVIETNPGLLQDQPLQQLFIDVPASHRAFKEINYLAAGKVVSGSTDGHFSPDRHVTRAEAAAMFGRSLEFNGASTVTNFPDVGQSNFASGYIQAATDKKIISGYGDGTFKPDKIVSRGEMALLICRAFGYDVTNTQASIKILMSKGIAQGLSDGTFGETLPLKRSDFSVFLARSINPTFIQNYQSTGTKNATVKSEGLQVYNGPLTNYGIISTLVNGEEVEVLNEFGNWVMIKSQNTEGYVLKEFLEYRTDTGSPDPGNVLDYLKSQTIVIDAGHGGHDPGASGYNVQEKAITLDVALKVQSYFAANTPFNIKLTREDGKYLQLSERVALAKKWNGNVFVSIHTNSVNGKVSGTETFYYSRATNPHVQQSKLLAECIQKRMIEAWKLNDRGVKKGNLHVLRENSMPAALVELAFIDHKEDNKLLASEYSQDIAAKAIYNGILDYYKANGTDVTPFYK